jgi:transcriptional regulator with XRE-family HTH domain
MSQDGLRAERLRYGLSQWELAEIAGVALRTVNNFENGRHRPQRETLAALVGAIERAKNHNLQLRKARA